MSAGRVLIVDDQPEALAGIVCRLQEAEIEVSVHPSVITAPFLLRALDPDVILLDLSLPGLSAGKVLANRRSCLKTDAPVILFDGRTNHELARMVEELGADGSVSKADEHDAIVHRIKTWILTRRVLADA